MSKIYIKKMELTNFGCFKNEVVELNENLTLIKGKNGVGKSTKLKAGTFLIGNYMLSDNYGVDEKNIEQIITIGADVREYPCVTITLSDDSTFTKKYVSTVSNGKVTGHRNQFFVGAESYKEQDFLDTLYAKLGFKNTLKGFKSDVEMRIHTDLLYALQKMNPSDLRKYLMQKGAYVGNDEIFEHLAGESKIQYLKENIDKYPSGLYGIKAEAKRKIVSTQNSINDCNAQLELFKDVDANEVVDTSAVEDEITNIQREMFSLENKELADEKNKLLSELRAIEIDKSVFIANKESHLKGELQKLTNLRAEEYKRINDAKNDSVKELRMAIDNYVKEIDFTTKKIEAYEKSVYNIKLSISTTSDKGKELVKRIADNTLKLDAEKLKKFDGYTTCPACSNRFVLHPKDKKNWEMEHLNKIYELETTIEIDNAELPIMQKRLEQQKAERDSTLVEIEKCKIEMKRFDDEKIRLNKLLGEKMSSLVDTSNADAYDVKIDVLNKELDSIDTSEFDKKIRDIRTQIQKIEEESESFANDKRIELNSVLEIKKMERDNLLHRKSSIKTKNSIIDNLDELTASLNDYEERLAIVDKAIKKSIELCNKKAKDITGFDFVMLEENLSNDGVTECCYCLVKGIPFNQLETSMKYLYGIKFIQRMREIDGGTNNLPIFADKFESIDDDRLNEWMDQFNNLQIIGTKVTNE